MSPAPLVSIVTPSYNQAAFLEQTIQSVLNQDYAPIEYMIVDGASTDGSLEIIRRYSDRLAWWVSEPDAGQAEAINKGLRRCRGEYIAWLNSDDIYLPGAISQAVAAFQKRPELGLVFGDAITIDARGKPLGRFAFEDWELSHLVSFRIICQPAVFMRRSVLEKAGLLEPTFHFMLDHQLWIRIARLSPILHIPGSLWAAARHHAAAKNVSQAAGFGRETLQVLEWMLTQPDLAEWIRRNERRVLAGAYRLNARYLLDDGLAAKSLASYLRSLFYRPSFALKHWHRMLFALADLLGLKKLAQPLVDELSARSKKRLTNSLRHTNITLDDRSYPLAAWPGLDLND